MHFYIVRHGAPDYKTDTLLESGKLQAQAVSERMVRVNPDLVFSSPLGRAVETASYTAKRLNKEVLIADWANEIGARTEFPDGVSKTFCQAPANLLCTKENEKLNVEESLQLDVFTPRYRTEYKRISDGTDRLLSQLGFERNSEGHYDFTHHVCDKAVLFCHCIMMKAMLSHLFSIPPHKIISTVFPNFTSVTLIELREEKDTMPRLCVLGDVGHLYEANLPVPNYMFRDELF